MNISLTKTGEYPNLTDFDQNQHKTSFSFS